MAGTATPTALPPVLLAALAVLMVAALAAVVRLARAARDANARTRLLAAQLDAARLDLERERADAQATRRRLEDAIDALPVGFELYDADDRLVLANRTLRAMYPAIADRMREHLTFEQLVRANHAAGVLRTPEPFETWLPKRLAQRRQQPGTPVLHQIGDGRWVRGFEMPTPDGGLVGVRLDVSELVQQQSRAEAATRQLQEAIEALPDGFALYDADDRLAVFNRRYRELYAASAPAIRVGATFEEILRYGLAHGQYPDAAGRENDWLADRLYRHRNPGPPQLQALPDNRWLRIDERSTADGGLAGVRTDVTALVQREQELQRLNARLDELNAQLTQLSDTDALTGVANRRQFDRRLGEEWARAARHAAPLSLLLVDVDHFKRFNDALGHPRGDECLRAVAQALHGCARRASDVVARYGGEEFALLLPYVDAHEARVIAEHCLHAVDALGVEHGDSPLGAHVTISVGVATTVPTLGDGPGALLRDADRALYRAKQAGRHRAVAADAA